MSGVLGREAEGVAALPASPKGTAMAQDAAKATVAMAAKDLKKCMVKINGSAWKE